MKRLAFALIEIEHGVVFAPELEEGGSKGKVEVALKGQHEGSFW